MDDGYIKLREVLRSNQAFIVDEGLEKGMIIVQPRDSSSLAREKLLVQMGELGWTVLEERKGGVIVLSNAALVAVVAEKSVEPTRSQDFQGAIMKAARERGYREDEPELVLAYIVWPVLIVFLVFAWLFIDVFGVGGSSEWFFRLVNPYVRNVVAIDWGLVSAVRIFFLVAVSVVYSIYVILTQWPRTYRIVEGVIEHCLLFSKWRKLLDVSKVARFECSSGQRVLILYSHQGKKLLTASIFNMADACLVLRSYGVEGKEVAKLEAVDPTKHIPWLSLAVFLVVRLILR